MLKKISILLFLVLPLYVAAQDFKFGHINRQELLEAMPEATEAQKQLEDLVLKYRTETTRLEEELQTRYKEFQENQASLAPAIRSQREAELYQLQERIQSFGTLAQEELQKKQMELMIPIEDKINKAIQAVGAEGNFTYIFDLQSQAVLYYSAQSTDVLSLVKKKMNL
jgi:outer membrane protein